MCADGPNREVGWLISVGVRGKVRQECERGSFLVNELAT